MPSFDTTNFIALNENQLIISRIWLFHGNYKDLIHIIHRIIINKLSISDLNYALFTIARTFPTSVPIELAPIINF